MNHLCTKKRSPAKISFDILKNIGDWPNGILHTKLLYRSNLDTVALQKFLNPLIARGLVVVESRKYHNSFGRKVLSYHKFYLLSDSGRLELVRLSSVSVVMMSLLVFVGCL